MDDERLCRKKSISSEPHRQMQQACENKQTNCFLGPCQDMYPAARTSRPIDRPPLSRPRYLLLHNPEMRLFFREGAFVSQTLVVACFCTQIPLLTLVDNSEQGTGGLDRHRDPLLPLDDGDLAWKARLQSLAFSRPISTTNWASWVVVAQHGFWVKTSTSETKCGYF